MLLDPAGSDLSRIRSRATRDSGRVSSIQLLLRRATVVSEAGFQWSVGLAFVSEDSGKSFEKYRLRLRLGPASLSLSQIDWAALLPDQSTTGWLYVDRDARTMEVV